MSGLPTSGGHWSHRCVPQPVIPHQNLRVDFVLLQPSRTWVVSANHNPCLCLMSTLLSAPSPLGSTSSHHLMITRAFYQIPLSKASMKYCGVATPFRGSETALEELMCRVLGDFLQEGCTAKLADDLYCGGETPQELLANCSRILDAVAKCNLRLPATKTVICPKTTTI